MGSILSFPILCLINLLAYWISIDQYKGCHQSLSELRVLINGDDILFPSNNEHYKIWCETITQFGFKLSLGKNYTHTKICTVNSQTYWKSNTGYKPVGFLNTGLLTGQSKKSGRDAVKSKPMRDYYNEVVHQSCNPLRTHQRFMHYFKEEISQMTKKGDFNLFIPRDQGGLGFIPPPGLDVSLTFFQKSYANFIQSAITRRIQKDKNPFRLCLFDESKERTALPWLTTRTKYVWTDKALDIKLKTLQRPLLSSPPTYDPQPPDLHYRLPNKRILGAFRRLKPFVSREFDLKVKHPTIVEINYNDQFLTIINLNRRLGNALTFHASKGWDVIPSIPGW